MRTGLSGFKRFSLSLGLCQPNAEFIPPPPPHLHKIQLGVYPEGTKSTGAVLNNGQFGETVDTVVKSYRHEKKY